MSSIVILKILAWLTLCAAVFSAYQKLDKYRPEWPIWESIAFIWTVAALYYATL